MNELHITLKHEDSRGKIFKVESPGFTYQMMFTKAGTARSGDVHPCIQYDFIFSGKWDVWMLENGEHKKKEALPGPITIPANTPHLFICKEDSWMIEYWDLPFDKIMNGGVGYYQPYRKIVERMMKDKAYVPNLPNDFEVMHA